MGPRATTTNGGWRTDLGRGLAALLLTCASLIGQEISDVTPDEGTLGDLVTIQGSGFGEKKPKVELIDPDTGKKAKGSNLKVLSATDTTITVMVKKAKAGGYDLRVRPKGADAIEAPGAFAVQPPMILPSEDQAGEPGDSIVVDVAFLGSKKPKAWIGAVPAGVQASDDDTVALVIPTKLANGTWPVTLTTPVGSSTSPALVTVTGSEAPLGKAFLDVRVDGEAFKVKKKDVLVEPGPYGLTLTLPTTKKGVTRSLVLQLPVDWSGGAAPATIALAPGGGGLVRYSVSDDDPLTTTWTGEALTAELFAFADGQLAAGFTALLVADGAEDVTAEGTVLLDVEAPDLDPGSPLLTTVTGLVLDTGLAPVAGAEVTTSNETVAAETSAADGTFAFTGHPLSPEPLVVRATLGELSAFALVEDLLAGGVSPAGLLVLDVDTDGDGLPDWYEVNVSGSDPLLPDADNDDFNDDLEVLLGLDPNTPDASTTISGAVTLADLSPAVGASVRVQGAPAGFFEGTTSGSGGVMIVPDWPAALTPVVLEAELLVPGEGLLEGQSLATATVPAGMTVVPTFALAEPPDTSGMVLFPAPKTHAGPQPQAFLVDDVDADGRADAVVCSRNDFDDNLWVLLGQGDGRFVVGSTSVLGDSVEDLAGGDLDGDGVLDLVTANGFFDQVSVALGQGDGSFGVASDFATGQGPLAVAVADLNGDGDQDVASVDGDDETVSVLLGDGTGQLGAPTAFDVDADPLDLAVVDLDGDGARDLVVVNSGSASLSLLFGQGDGSFDPAVGVPVGDEPVAVAVGDLDEDGRPDLVTANSDSVDASVLLNLGGGLFDEALSVPLGNQFFLQPSDVALGDLDLDGHLDLVVASVSSAELFVSLGDGAGAFTAPTAYRTDDLPERLAIADLDGDGPPELLSLPSSGQDLTVLLAEGGGLFRDRDELPGEAGAPNGVFTSEALAAGDLDNDGDIDLLAAVAFDTIDHLRVLPNDGSGMPTYGPSYAESLTVLDVVLGDLDGDGALDAVSARHDLDTLAVRPGGGDGTLGDADLYAVGNGPTELLLADLNGDGDLDLVSTDQHDDQVSVLLGQGDGSFDDPVAYPAGDGPRSLAAADLDGDGVLDVVAAAELDDELSLLFGVGDGSLLAPQALAAGDEPWAVDVADLDGDGDQDLVVANQDSGDLSLWLGDGLGAFVAAEALPTSEDTSLFAFSQWPLDVVATDVDGDGAVDLAVVNYLAAEVGLLRGEGGGAFATVERHATGSGPRRLVVTDLDGDGLSDLVTTSEQDALWMLFQAAPPAP